MGNFPEKVNDMRVFVPGRPDYKGIGDVKLPSFEPLTDTISGAGLAGEYDSVSFGQFGSMKFGINWRMITDELEEFLKLDAVMVDCRIANQEYDTTAGAQKFVPNRVLVRGQVTKNDLGKAEKGSSYEGQTEIEVTYIKLERNGKTLVELDKFNYIYVVSGVDYMQRIRAALGM